MPEELTPTVKVINQIVGEPIAPEQQLKLEAIKSMADKAGVTGEFEKAKLYSKHNKVATMYLIANETPKAYDRYMSIKKA